MLGRRAEANALRILDSRDDRCLGAVFTWEAWLVVCAMMAAGFALRHSGFSRTWIGLVYAAVGSALLLASASPWSHFRQLRARRTAEDR